MKVLSVLLIALLLAACGPSAEEIAATADAAQAQTETAAPTLTFTVTSTPTHTPTPTQTLTPTSTLTFTPSPTPSIPKVQGNVEVEFISMLDDFVPPQPPHEIELVLSSSGNEFIIDLFDEQGNFFTYLEPGKYNIEYLRIRTQELGDEMHQISTNRVYFVVPSQPCYHAGSILFTLWRLDPGTYEEQASQTELISIIGGSKFDFIYLEAGGLLNMTFPKISEAGACPNFP